MSKFTGSESGDALLEETVVNILQIFIGSDNLTGNLQSQFGKIFGQASSTHCKWAYQVCNIRGKNLGSLLVQLMCIIMR
jgi:hypothetical protein